MPTPKKGPRLGGSASHQRHILANLATALFEHGKITTTESRARTLRPVAEKLITKAKKGDLHNRREVLKTIRDKSVVHVLFTEIGPKMAERPGGYTRITKIGNRKGDNAPMAVIELVQEAYQPADKKPGQEGCCRRPPPKAEEAHRRDRRRGARGPSPSRRGDLGRELRGPRVRRRRRRGARGRLPRRRRSSRSRATRTPASTTRRTPSGTTRPSPRSGSRPRKPPRTPASSRPADSRSLLARARHPRGGGPVSAASGPGPGARPR